MVLSRYVCVSVVEHYVAPFLGPVSCAFVSMYVHQKLVRHIEIRPVTL